MRGGYKILCMVQILRRERREVFDVHLVWWRLYSLTLLTIHSPYTHTHATHTHNLTHTSQWITCSDWSLSTRSCTEALYFYGAEMPDSSSRSYIRFCAFTSGDRFVLSCYWSWSLNVSQRSGRAAQQHPSVSICLRTIHQLDQWAKKSMCSHSIILRKISI